MTNQEKILNEIKAERTKQDKQWGEQNHPALIEHASTVAKDTGLEQGKAICFYYGIPSEEIARKKVERGVSYGNLTYMHILIEEISEAASCGENTKALREELVQSAAVIVAMLESLDRNGK